MRRIVIAVLGTCLAVTGLFLAIPPEESLAADTPPVSITPMASGLSNPWDMTFTPDGTMLFTQRAGGANGLSIIPPGAANRPLSADLRDLYANGETGLMGIVVDPNFPSNRLFYTCQGYLNGQTKDIRVIRWTLNLASTAAVRTGQPVVTGIPIVTGRHGGCRLRFDTNGYLYVGTGDAAVGTNPQDRTSLGGKVLRVTHDGRPAPGNPFINSANANERLVFTYGHRNVQGLALRPGNGQMWSAEQGTSRDDEVNRLTSGANYGYNPVPGYNENVPMTTPGATPAVYSTGATTLALSGATFLQGPQWGRWDGALAVAALKDQSLRILTLSGTQTLVSEESMPELTGAYGRLRAAQLAPDGSLYVSTDNGGGQDRILRITPLTTPDLPGMYRGTTFFFRDSLTSGQSTNTVVYGNNGDIPMVCDWDGDGVSSLGIVRKGVWWITDGVSSAEPPRSFVFGNPFGDIPICGDWDGDGRDGPGVVRAGGWYLRDAASTGPHDIDFGYGNNRDTPVVGDWDGDGRDGPGVVQGRNWFLRNALSTGPQDYEFSYGDIFDMKIVGDWNGDGRDGPGVTRGGDWYLRNALVQGPPHDISFVFGTVADIPYVW